MKRALLILLLALPAAAETMSVGEYITALSNIRGLLVSSQLAAAGASAQRLAAYDVTSPQGTFHADRALLGAIARASRADIALIARLDTTIEELRRAAGADAPPPDPRLLQQVAAEQDVPELAPGGELPTHLRRDIPLLERIARAVADALEWIGKKIVQFLRWLLDFLPSRGAVAPGATFGMRWIVIAVVTLIVIAILIVAVEAMRRSRRGKAEKKESSAPIGSKRDEDPLSRGATEWERYAAQLADEGRYREAIRAWYHAVLVTCYAGGILHFRKGRTNWEYVAALPPSYAWRAEFIQLTRRFEQEWYGHDQSTPEALDECSERAERILDAVHRRAA